MVFIASASVLNTEGVADGIVTAAVVADVW
jgi:hypothetical protein